MPMDYINFVGNLCVMKINFQKQYFILAANLGQGDFYGCFMVFYFWGDLGECF